LPKMQVPIPGVRCMKYTVEEQLKTMQDWLWNNNYNTRACKIKRARNIIKEFNMGNSKVEVGTFLLNLRGYCFRNGIEKDGELLLGAEELIRTTPLSKGE